jgi:hypothetical protein
VRDYVARLAAATDEENQYAQATLEHHAFAELLQALADALDADPARETSH